MTDMERQNIENEIAICKQQLTNTDYKALKHAEGAMEDVEWEPTKTAREEWRKRINELEAEIKAAEQDG